MQRMVAVVCLVAGVFELFGTGWALLAAGALLWLRDDRAAIWLTHHRVLVRTRARRDWQRLRAAPRRSLAASAMGAAVVMAPSGVLVSFGIGMAVIVLAGLLVGLGILLGWGE